MRASTKHFWIINLIAILFSGGIHKAIAQGTDSRLVTGVKDKLFLSVIITPQMTSISTGESFVSKSLDYKKGMTVSPAFEGGYFFSGMAGISIGAALTPFTSQISMDSCSIKYQAIDSEDEEYEMRIKGRSITEDQKLSFLSIPVCLVLRVPAGEKLGIFLKGGISFEIPVVKTFKGAGTFTYDGFYPEYPVLLQDLPAYGFPTNHSTNSSGSLEIKSLSQNLVASGGILFALKESVHLTFGISYIRSLGNISEYDPGSDFKLSSKPDEMLSIMSGGLNSGAQALGVSLGIRFYIK